ncbi:unnamed protein product [Sympodiomycopsis kandeliae]
MMPESSSFHQDHRRRSPSPSPSSHRSRSETRTRVNEDAQSEREKSPASTEGDSIRAGPTGRCSSAEADGEKHSDPMATTAEQLEKGAPSPTSLDAATPSPPPGVVIPDGGTRAWVTSAGSFISLFASFGTVNAYGAFQEYYTTQRLTNYSESLIALNGAIQLFLLYGLAAPIGRVFDAYGTKWLMRSGSFLMVFSLFMLSLCQPGQAYQYFLCQALLFGTGAALVFTPALSVNGHWFSKKRGVALGITASGSGLGGVIFPIVIQRLLPRLGWGWTVRVVAFIVLGCQIFACFAVRANLPAKGMTRADFFKVIDLRGWKDIRFVCLALGSFCIFYALFIPYFYIESSAIFVGMDKNLATYMLSIINATGIPSRLFIGFIADRTGPLNIMIPMLLLSGIFPLALWLPARGDAAIIAFSALYGLASGCFVSLVPAYIARISPPSTIGARLGSVYAFISIANLVGTPTAGALVGNKNTQADFNRLIIFTGALVLAGAGFIVLARLLEEKRKVVGKRERIFNGLLLKA